jgi:predicted RecA/RadA family phage recombinase
VTTAPASGGGGLGSLATILVTATIAFIILFIGIAVINPIIGITGSTGGGDSDAAGEFTQATVLLDGAGTWVAIGDDTGVNESVYDSRGSAVHFADGNDSYIESSRDVEFSSGGNWTVSLWASRNESATAGETRGVLNLDGQLQITHNDTSSDWTAHYYDEGARTGTNVSVTSTSQPGSLTNIQVVRAGDDLTIYRNTTAGETADLNDSGVFEAPVDASDWHGRLEELRVYDDALDASTRNDLYSDPNGPTTGWNQSGRAMFDEPGANRQRLFYSDAYLEQSNVSFERGHPGTVLDEGSFGVLGADYEWNKDGPELKPVGGGRLDGAPVAYVDYNLQTVDVGRLTGSFTDALVLAGLLPVILILGYIATTLDLVGGGRGQ